MKTLLLVTLLVALPAVLSAQPDYIEVNAPGNRQLKLAVEPVLSPDGSSPLDASRNSSEVITNDINMSGVVMAEGRSLQPPAGNTSLSDVNYAPWLTAGFDMLVRSELSLQGDRLVVEFRLFDVVNRKMITAKRYLGVAKCPKFNVVGKEEINNLQLATFIADAQNKKLKYDMVDFHTSRPGHDLRYALSGDFMRELGWEPKLSVKERITEVVDWSLEHKEWIEL